MNVFPLQNANSSVISVTGTASYILPLINTAGAVTHTFPPGLDALDITPENGDIRIVIDPSTAAVSPTASKGFLIKQGATLMLRHSSLSYIKAIATSGTVSCSLQVGESEPNETTVISGGGGAITSIVPGTGATNLGKAEDAAFTTGDTGVMALGVANEAGSNLSGTDGDYTPIRTNRAGTVFNQDTTAPVYEENTTGKAIVEENYSTTRVTADGQIKASAGFVRHISFAATGTVTAGTITLYNNTAESGTVLWSGIIQVGTAPVTVPINADATLGIYVGYDGTVANVATHVSWR
jgi:hypothetical protein